ncbi:MAG TPA: ABC-2 transporter permease [Candidatus Onthocola stercoravium]|nr:ABC-2 transporter permease [Candidatus Onthocola stercoravium]
MLGLVKKDLLMIKGNIRQVILFLVVFLVLAFQENNIIVIVPVFVSMMVFITTFSYDEYNKWDAYAIALPISRKNIVKSKYIASVILWLIALLVTVVITVIMGIIGQNINYFEMFGMILGCVFSIVLLEAIMFPLIFKFGVEKGRIGLFVGVFAIAALLGFIFTGVDLENATGFIEFFNKYYYILLPLAIIILLMGSYFVSKRIYLKKEF